MLTNERQEELLRILLAQGTVAIADVSRRLGVSEMTVRRDLEHMEEEGLVQRVRGGADLLGETLRRFAPDLVAVHAVSSLSPRSYTRAVRPAEDLCVRRATIIAI